MKFLVMVTRALMMAIGITLPKPEHEKIVAVIWVVSAFAMIAIILGVGWAVLQSMASSMNAR